MKSSKSRYKRTPSRQGRVLHASACGQYSRLDCGTSAGLRQFAGGGVTALEGPKAKEQAAASLDVLRHPAEALAIALAPHDRAHEDFHGANAALLEILLALAGCHACQPQPIAHVVL